MHGMRQSWVPGNCAGDSVEFRDLTSPGPIRRRNRPLRQGNGHGMDAGKLPRLPMFVVWTLHLCGGIVAGGNLWAERSGNDGSKN